NPNPIAPLINLCENDTAGRCTCAACLEADGSPMPAEVRRANARRRFESGDEAWYQELGPVTNRYAKFFMRVLEEVDRVAPDRKAGIAGNIYANYSEPPSIRMSPRILHRFCPPIMFPWSGSKINAFKRLWAGWRATGCELILRPNFTLDGHDYPINYAAEFSECLRFAHANGLVGLDMDSCTGQWPVMGTTLYTIARLTCDPTMSDEQILGEYYAAFGPAAPAVRTFFDETARISRRFADDLPREQNAGIVGGDYSKFKLHAHHIFTPEVFARLIAILEDAGQRAAATPLAAKRVAWLRNGLEHARLTAETARAFEEYMQTKDIRSFGEAQKRLDDFRAAHEMEFLANIGFLRHLENFDWPSRAAARMLMENNLKLPVEWQFRLDPQDLGMKERWFAYDHDTSGWQKIRTDAPWEPQIGAPYDGYGWYRLELDMPEKIDGTPIIIFGAVDEACMVWCNGMLVHRRPYPFQGDRDSWMEPFEVSLHNAVFPGRKNVIVVRVEDRSGAGGIWKPCHLKVK
ncbi:MAG: DUF4838 domain-containing protein, partial [Victivallales bacterium]|nr:DUF4838 domain-containing protein [Victivallales bacterium]